MQVDPPVPNGNNPPGPADPGANPPSESVKNAEAVLAKNRELVAELAKIKAERDADAKAKKDAEDEALKANAKWKEVAEAKEKELSEAKAKIAQVETQEKQRRKLAAVVSSADGNIDTKWYRLIHDEYLDDVKVDANGDIDKTSVAAIVEKMRKEYPEIIKAKGGPNLPNNAPGAGGGNAGTVLYSKWVTMPSAEQKKWKQSQIVDG